MAFLINFADTKTGIVTRHREFHHIDQARSEMNDLLNGIANHEKANEFQPNTFGKKDYFHFYVMEEDGVEYKRAYFITRLFKTEKFSLRTGVEQREMAKKLMLNVDYFE